ncbi:MAG: ATP-binding cassette domain-containing protein [Candidatus Altiarchaeia archaeon]
MENSCALKVDALVKKFDTKQVLDGISFCVEKGELFGLMGPNGAGKTTMIRIILDILNPDAGKFELFGAAFNESIKERIGYLPEEGGLYRKTSVYGCIRYFADLKGRPVSDAEIDSWLKRMSLFEYREKNVGELSKGLHRKLQFIIAVIHKPDLLIVDEPFYGLDPINKMQIEGLIKELKNGGMTIIMSTHQMDEVEKMCDRILLINKGRTVLYGNLQEVKSRYGYSIMVEFEGLLPVLSGVSRVNDHGNQAELLLEKNADTQEILRKLASSVRITRFEVKTRSLNEIFIEEVGK